MLWKTLAYLRRQIFLSGFVRSSHWISFVLIFELNVNLPSEVIHQYPPGPPGYIDRVPFYFYSLGIVPKLQINTIYILKSLNSKRLRV